MMPNPALLAGLGGAIVLYVLSRTEGGATVVAQVADAALDKLPRGIRNNNPGNIDWIADPAKRWKGMVRRETASEGGRFGIFDTPANGVRAIAKELLLDDSRGIRTIGGLIGNWAPSNENNTVAYAWTVARALGVTPTQTIRVRENLPGIVAAIVQHENGTQPYPVADIQRWVYLT